MGLFIDESTACFSNGFIVALAVSAVGWGW
jgi:hypothetical protein